MQTTDTPHPIVIATTQPFNADVPPTYIWFRPSNLSFNDFRHITIVDIGFVEDGQLVFAYSGKAAYRDPEKGEYVGVGNALLATPEREGGLIITDVDQVFSLAAEQEDYRRMIRQFGVDAGNRMLASANDLVAIAGRAAKRSTLRAALQSDVFRFSLIRGSEAYYAFKNAAPILRGLDQEDLQSGPASVIINLTDQDGRDVPIDFTFDHHSTIPRRTCVIIGKNGVGKSRALGAIARKALTGIRGDASQDDDRIMASRVLAFTPGNENTATFPNEGRKRPATFYKRLSTSRARPGDTANTATANIVEVFRNNREIGGKSRFSIFLQAVQALNRPDEIAFRAGSHEEHIRLTSLLRSSEQRQLQMLTDMDAGHEPGRIINGHFHHLSTGEVRFVKLLAQACTYIENGTLLLLDEPETHLHPNFIARLMSALETLIEATGSCAIMATHSVYVVREVFHDQVVIVEKDSEGRIVVKDPGMRTFGADISSISAFIFGEEDTSFLADDVIRRINSENLSFEEVRAKYGKWLSRELLSELRGDE